MLLQTPDWRSKLLETKTTGVDAFVDSFLEGPPSEVLQQVHYIRSNSFLKMYLEASLMATSDFGHISEVLDIPDIIIQTYAKIYYDIEGWNRLQKLSLMDNVSNPEERTLKIWSLSQGLDFIAWRLGKKVEITALDGLTALFNDCIYKSKEAIFNENASSASKESVKWVKLSIEIAKLLKIWVMDSKAASKDIELALKEINPNFEDFESFKGELKAAPQGDLFANEHNS